MMPDACSRSLQASTEGQGVTGFVAATGKEFTSAPIRPSILLYLPGAHWGAATSSLTVPG